MAIKCSLLGHRYTGTTVEEEREEEGSEVVITVKEVERCERCGKERVVSQNKEVTSIAAEEAANEGDAAPAATDDTTTKPDGPETGGPVGTSTAEAGPAVTSNADADGDDAELIGSADADTGDDRPEPATAAAEGAADADGDDAAEGDPDDDAVILDDAEEERDPGEWPEDAEADAAAEDTATADTEAATTTPAETAAEPAAEGGPDTATTATEDWPDEYGYEEGSDARADEVDWPEEDGGDDEWTPTENLTESIDGAAVRAAGTASTTVPEGEFVCPECGFVTSVEESSLRSGDPCPDCHRGWLDHRADDETRKE